MKIPNKHEKKKKKITQQSIQPSHDSPAHTCQWRNEKTHTFPIARARSTHSCFSTFSFGLTHSLMLSFCVHAQVVLSACSSYFQKLLLSNPCKHPTIIMPQDVCFSDLKFIIEFVYRGEIDVSQAELQVSELYNSMRGVIFPSLLFPFFICCREMRKMEIFLRLFSEERIEAIDY